MGLRTEGYTESNNLILGPEDIGKHAVELARELQVKKNSRFPRGLIGRMNKNYKYILDVYKGLTRNGEEVFPSSPTAEWLLDNFYIIEEQVKDIRFNLTKKYYTQLPVIQRGDFKGYPRAYAIAIELVTHTDGSIDEKTLMDFTNAFQTQAFLTIGELWAIAMMLRIALIENIKNICENIVRSQQDYYRAEEIADLVIRNIDKGEEELLRLVKEQISSKDLLSSGFVEHFLQKLRNQGSKTGIVVGYIDDKLKEKDSSLEEAAGLEHRLKAATQVSMGNSITSLRLVSAMDWHDIFESLSRVENILREDPRGLYAQMDFDSRDSYRHEIEKFALLYDTSEITVAQKAVECAKEAVENENLSVSHVGYYLRGKGRSYLERKLGGKPKGIRGSLGAIKKYPSFLYFGLMVLLTVTFVNLFLYYGLRNQTSLTPLLFLFTGLVILIPISDIVISILNFIVSYMYKPVILPKLELKQGITPDLSTMIIVPTLLPNAKRVNELLEQLEISYLANREKNLYFALVGDFKDSLNNELPEDNEIINAALTGIKELNSRYAREDKDIFYYFHRYRKFNSSQTKWMGWERKRGAILELNDLLLGSSDTGFDITSCEVKDIPKVKYVITLDADTNLSLGTAKKLIGTLAHPLNKAVVDWDKQVVVGGYGILQPRIGINLNSANTSLFTRIFAGQGGIDPYTTAIFDVYQDLFGEGIFTGKGIYELDTFQGLLKSAIPENAILSHDLLEGSHIRAGLVTDIELIDGYPAGYHSFAMRLHRWVRGDWQLLPWLGGKVKDKEGNWRKNPLSPLSKWKIIDNLRRSLVSPALFVLMALSFSLLSLHGFLWLGLAILTTIFPALMYLVGTLFGRNVYFVNRSINSSVISGFKSTVYQAVLQLVFVPYQAYLMMDAVLRTVYRVFFSKKNMLEWVTAADLESTLKNDVTSFFKRMWVSPISGLFVMVLSITYAPRIAPLAAVLLVLWVSSPYIAYKISQKYTEDRKVLDEESNQVLRRLARKTWAYFEDLVTPEENYLPPDNFQVDPPNGIAHRTSPTNIGMMFVSTVTARDLGFIGTWEMFERIDASLKTIEGMEKWEGHLYNWYDTKNLEVLRPRYISTVDSGNFVGYLMVLVQALQEYVNKPLVDIQMAFGLKDTVILLNEEIQELGLSLSTETFDEFIADGNHEIKDWHKLLDTVQAEVSENDLKEKRIRKTFWGKKLQFMLNNLKQELEVSQTEKVAEQYQELRDRINRLIDNTKFTPLFDSKRQLFSIGYNVEEGMLTKSYYDLLASEARQASYIAIARGEVDKKHWYRLGRKLTQMDKGKGLLSWTGTMFEYLMPLLIMGNYENSLLDETYNFVIQAQKRYGKKRNIPWGTSESAYYAFDINLNYQYKAFGVPELGFKRGLANDMVVAPYATVLAVMVDPQGAMENIRRLLEDGLDGEYGLYEAIDYTPSRLGNSKGNIIKNFMVHHQGMSILALNNYLNNNIMQERFHANPIIRSAELLLQERIPTKAIFSKEYKDDFVPVKRMVFADGEAVRKLGIPDSEMPQMHLLSNGSYSVMLTNGGSGYSKHKDMAVARWKGNLRGTNTGIYLYIQNINANNVWSATFEPYNVVPEEYTVVFSPDKGKFTRKDGNIETTTEIVVSPEDNAEIRKVSLTNHSEYSRVIEITSYFEVVLTHPDADIAHPTFSNLFVTTEYVPEYNCLLASRRPRSEGEKTVLALHTVAVEGEAVGDLQYETDRSKFIGRNRALSNPLAMDVDQPLSNTVGAVLDPVMSIRKRVKIEPGQTVRLSYTVAVAESRKDALVLADKYRDLKTVERAFELAWNRSQIEGRFLSLKASEMELYLNMVPAILYSSPLRLKWRDVIQKNKKGQPGLWLYGISGDIPIVVLTIKNKEHLEKVYSLLKGHEYWRMKGLTVDLVILIEDESGYSQPLQDKVRDAISATHARDMIGRNGGVFMLNAELMPEEDKILLFTVARIIITGDGGPIEEQLEWKSKEADVPKLSLQSKIEADVKTNQLSANCYDTSKLKFFNGLGGFSQDGKEYIIYLRHGQHTPAPWINVISNHHFGFNISEVGAGYTWAENSRENKLTPWYNDPVTDSLGEIFYLRDETYGDYWSLTPMPIREKEDYIISHGQGYTTFEHNSHGIEQTLTEFVSLEDPVKLCLLSLRNDTETSKEISLTYFMRPVLGVNERVNSQYITSETYGDRGVLLLHNTYSSDYPGRVVFIDSSEPQRYVSGDREEFIGINRSLENPEIMERTQLSGRVGAGLDPCGAMQVKVSLGAGESKEIIFLLGQGRDTNEVVEYTKKYSNIAYAKEELVKVKSFWEEKLGAIRVKTPDDSLDYLVNGWLQYQVISCRLWSRAAYYQSGGAYGFRDQLQDVMSVVYIWPELTRKQILLHSAHQFPEGDVQHWWHPGLDKGIRTRYSDDLLWLPYVTADYIQATADWSVLAEETTFIESDPLKEHEDERYDIPGVSKEKADVYDHCVRAIEKALKFGEHGIPLMGSGDWNDGMNTVGNKGKGESIWLGWFLYTVLQKFIPICQARKDAERAERYQGIAEEIAQAIEKNGWDGSWYRRAYFDDGTPLGSAQNTECKIDAIAQSWSIISGIGRPHRAEEAMNAVENYLVDRQAGIIKLLTPPFHDGHLEPGYIKSYIPGVRENGGQYTHAAVWTVMAFAKLGKGDKVGELFHLINPINHARTPIECSRYKVEPYVVAADVYAVNPNTGRGGWSWYTGAAGWMYRLCIEYIIGIRKIGESLSFDPCIPRGWGNYEVEYRYKNTLYHIRIKNPQGVNKGVQRVTLDGTPYEKNRIDLIDDGIEHLIEVVMGEVPMEKRESKNTQEVEKELIKL